MAEPNDAAREQASTEPRVQVTGAQIQQMIAQSGLNDSAVQQLAASLELSSQEQARVKSGAPLTMTAAQHASIQRTLATAYAEARRGGGGGSGGGSGGGGGGGAQGPMLVNACGCNGNPTPAPTGTGSGSGGTRIPANNTTRTDVTETNAGNSEHRASVGGGTIELRSGVEGNLGSTPVRDFFAISYTGPNAANSHLLQFVWREVIGILANNTRQPVAGSYTSSSGAQCTLTTTGTPAQGDWDTDTTSRTNPFYETGGAATRGAMGTTIYDRPGEATPFVNQAFAASAVRVESYAHFNTFLIQNDAVAYRVETNVYWNHTSQSAVPPRQVTSGTSAAATALSPATLRARFHQQYPAYNWLT